MLRLAAMEEILASGDRLKIAVATSIAAQSDDAILRSLAMRGFIITQGQVDFEVKFPAKLETTYQKAGDDPVKQTEVAQQLANNSDSHQLFNIHRNGRVMAIIFELDDDGMSGTAFTKYNGQKYDRHPGEIRVNGDTL